MSDFASYSGKNKAKEKSADEWISEAKRVASKYEGKSENDLLKAIYTQAVERADRRVLPPVLPHARRRQAKKTCQNRRAVEENVNKELPKYGAAR